MIVVGCSSNRTASISANDRSIDASTSKSDAADHSSWPALFGANRDNVSRESGLLADWPSDGPPILWERPVGTGYSSPVLANDRLIVLQRRDNQEILECIDSATGESLWTFDYPTTYKCRYEYSDGPYSTPIISNDRVYAMGAQGQFHAVSLEDGEPIWQRNLHADYEVPETLFGAGATPLLCDGVLFLSLGGFDAGVIALDAQNGETLWVATDHGASYATPCCASIHGRDYVFVVTFDGISALSRSTGECFWEFDFRPKSPDSINATSPVVCDDLVYMVTGPGPGSVCLRVLEDGSYEEVWRDRRVLDSQFNGLMLFDDCVFGFTSKRQGGAQFRCVELATGKLQWKFRSDLQRGSLVASREHIFLLGEDGHLASMKLRTDKAELVSLTPAPIMKAPCYSSPALYKQRLYLRNEERLLCLDLRPSH